MSASKKINVPGFAMVAAISFLCIGLCMYSLCKYYLLKQNYDQTVKYSPPVINYVKFQTLDGKDINIQDFRYSLDSKTKVIISVSGECDVIELYYNEAGSEPWQYQHLIYPLGVSPGKEHLLEYIWNVPNAPGTFWIVAYNTPVGTRSNPVLFIRK